jgi:hypothetical protein
MSARTIRSAVRRDASGLRAHARRRTLTACALVALLACPRWSAAQGRLTGIRRIGIAPAVEVWQFADPVPQLGMDGTPVSVSRATQWSVPLFATVPIGERWTFDVSTAYASGSVTLDGRDAAGHREYRLTGPADTKLRLTGRVVGDNVFVTLGLNAPTGRTKLDDEEYAALRVLSAPSLDFQTPALGSGIAGTTGVVFARQAGRWAWALGASYEFQGTFDPVALSLSGPVGRRYNPGDAIHLSLGADGLVGQHGTTFGVTADFYTSDRFRAGGERTDAPPRRLGPIYAALWEFRVAAPQLVRELSLFGADRYRTRFTDGGTPVPGSAGNYLDAGVRAVWRTPGRIGLLTALSARHQTGLDIDDAFTTAAFAGGGVTLGLVVGAGRYTLQPFVRGQLGQLDVGGSTTRASGFAAGVSLGASY